MKSVNFNEMFFRALIDKSGFYMKQYKSSLYNEEKFIAMKELEGGTYCVLITDDINEDIDVSEAINYLNDTGKNFSLNVLILTKENYISNNTYNFNKMVIDTYNNEIISCDESCLPLQQIFLDITKNIEITNNTTKNRILINEKTATLILISINIIIFLFTAFLSRDIFSINTNVLVIYGAKFGPYIEAGQYYRLLTCAFLHGGLIHLLCNMYSLYILGPQINLVYGTLKYIVIYFISCITSSLMSFILSPYTISVGASGAIFGLMGALIAFAFVERKKIDKSFMSGLLQVLALNLLIGMSLSNIDNYGHIGGLLGGIIMGYIFYSIKSKLN